MKNFDLTARLSQRYCEPIEDHQADLFGCPKLAFSTVF
jgi:hypothetical protein